MPNRLAESIAGPDQAPMAYVLGRAGAGLQPPSEEPVAPLPAAPPAMAPGMLPSRAGIASLKLTPQEQHLYEHHVHNITTGNYTDNGDGSYSTIRSIGVEGPGGLQYEIPTVWGGKVLSNREAIARAAAAGWNNWPAYKTSDEADARYEAMHKFMGKDQPPKKNGPQQFGPLSQPQQ